MSKISSEKEVIVTLKVPGKLSNEISSKGIVAPEFLEFVINSIQMENWVNLFLASKAVTQGNRTMIDDSSEGSLPKKEVSSLGTSQITPQWTEVGMRRYLSVLSVDKEMMKGFYLLAAYNETGPTPTSSDLKKTCGFDNDKIWYQELRVAKSRLSLQARKMNLPPLFYRPQTANGSRFHPLDPNAFVELKRCISEYLNPENSPSNWNKLIKTKDEGAAKGGSNDVK